MPRAFTTVSVLLAASVFAAPASAQQVLFDFNNAPLHSPLPIQQTAGGITAYLSGTGQGYSVQDSSAPVFPLGFSGRDIYPSSVFLADLDISFDQVLTEFSILYSPQELACDDSCTMRVTAYLGGNLVGSATHTAANPGTWPVDTLACAFPQGFDSVVVHYDSHPPTCQDYGVIFLADDMRVTPMGSGPTAFCYGDGTGMACPCSNSGLAGHGCENSGATGGALLAASGMASLSADTLQFVATDELPTTLSILFQGDSAASPRRFGDGVRCVTGVLKRLFVRSSVGGAVTVPLPGDASVSARSAALGDPIAPGSMRHYHMYYQDPSTSFCTTPSGSTFNISNALSVLWGT